MLPSDLSIPASVEAPPQQKPSARTAWRFVPRILGLVLVLILVQHGRAEEWPAAIVGGLVLALGIGIFMAWQAGRRLHDALCSIPFGIVLLLSIGAATALGTFIPQNATIGQLEDKFGAATAEWLQRLFLDDIFHSLWFSGLLALFSLSLVLVVLRRPFWRMKQWGFVLTHGGMVTVIVGGALGSRFGDRGMMALQKGQEQHMVSVDAIDGEPRAPLNLPFGVRLDDFEVEKYPDQLRFVVWRLEHQQQKEDVLQAIPLANANEWTRIARTDVSFRVREFREGTGAEADRPPRHLVRAEGLPEPLVVEVGKTYPVPGTARSFRVTQFLPNFYYDIEHKRGATRDDQPNNPTLEVEEVSANGNGNTRRQWLFAKMPGHGTKEGALPLKYTYSQTIKGPNAVIEVKDEKGDLRETTLYVADDSERTCVVGKHTFLTFQDKKGEPKAYRSKIAIVEDGQVVKEGLLAVNSPMSYGGYEFYQSDWRASDLDYSGVKVVSDPGLTLAYIGMIMVSLGVAYIYYVRPRL